MEQSFQKNANNQRGKGYNVENDLTPPDISSPETERMKVVPDPQQEETASAPPQFTVGKCTKCACRRAKKGPVSIPLKSSCVSKTLRHMRHRAFLKWYHGAHQQEWRWPSVIMLLFISGAVTLFAYYDSGSEHNSWSGIGHILSICFLLVTVAFFLIKVPLFIGRWSARISLLYICFLVVTFILIVTNRVTTLALSVKYSEKALLNDEALYDHGTSVVLPHQFFLYVAISFFLLQGVNFLFGVFYNTVVIRVANYYYLKSALFISDWKITWIEPIQLLVPSVGSAEKQRYLNALQENDLISNMGGTTQTLSCHLPLCFMNKPDSSSQLNLLTRPTTVATEPLHVSCGFRIECSRKLRFVGLRRAFACCKGINLFSWFPYILHRFCFNESKSAKDFFKLSRNPLLYHKKIYTRSVAYVGEVDERGEPNGFGSWNDDGDHYGERLIGYWCHGLPDAPHKSRELGTGSGFMCIRIGWGKYCLSDNSLKFGVANVECCVSGRFYKRYPLVTLHNPPSCDAECVASFENRTGMVASDRPQTNVQREDDVLSNQSFKDQMKLPSVTSNKSHVDKEEHTISKEMEYDAGNSKRDGRFSTLLGYLRRKTVNSTSNVELKTSKDSYGEEEQQANCDIKVPCDVFNTVELSGAVQDVPQPIKRAYSDVINVTQDATADPGAQDIACSTPRSDRPRIYVNAGQWKKRNKWEGLSDQGFRVLQPQNTPNSNITGTPESAIYKLGRTALNMPQHIFSGKSATSITQSAVFRRRKQKSIHALPWYYKSRRDMLWCFVKQCPHTPNFGIQPRSELVIGVDRERGVYIGGYGAITSPPLVNESNTIENANPNTTSTFLHAETDITRATLVKPTPDNVQDTKKQDLQPYRMCFFKENMNENSQQNLLGYISISILQRRFISFVNKQQSRSCLYFKLNGGTKVSKPNPRFVSCSCSCHFTPDLFEGTKQNSIAKVTTSVEHQEGTVGIELFSPQTSRGAGHNGEPMYRLNPTASQLDVWDSRFGNGVPVLEPQGWVCLDTAGSAEVLLYIHGFNNSHIESLQILGQMVAFGNFPNHIRLFLFSWPAGRGIWQFFSAFSASENPKTHAALFDMLNVLSDTGVQGVHILCHSMGSRLFLKSFSSICRLFRKVARGDCPQMVSLKRSGSMQLLTVTFLNPEYHLEDFVREDYTKLRQYCNHITIFADAKDKALMWSEFFSGKTALGKTVFGIWTPVFFPSRSSDFPYNCIKPSLHFLNTISFFHFGSALENALGEDGRDLNEHDIEWLDVDVIDTTFMDQNVHNLRHSFWSLNREIIEDIRELMVTRKRARQRTGRLDRRDGNVWVYRVAPGFLTSLFEISH